MSGFRTTAKFLLYWSPLCGPARRVFLSLFDRRKLQALNRARDLYGGFIGSGDLVFDVGAHIGDYTDTFLSLGARVVAVEPNAECADRIRKMGRAESLHVENVALGDCEGSAELCICSEDSASTLSEDRKRRFGGGRWERSVRVPVTTLDALVKRHGLPRFVKIDTEGYDDKVLQGMSFRPPALSFEYILDILNVALHSLVIMGEQYVYNYMVGQAFELVSPSWLTVKEMEKTLQNMSCAEGYGDILAKQLNLKPHGLAF